MDMSIGTIGVTPETSRAGQLASTQKSERTAAAHEAAAGKQVAKEFESLFIGMMLKSMRETTGKNTLTNGGHGEEVYRSLLDQEYAKALTERGGVGLAAVFEKQLVNPQGTNHHDKTNRQDRSEVTYENR